MRQTRGGRGWFGGVILAAQIAATVQGGAACYRTAQAAAAARGGVSGPEATGAEGYRVARIQTDPLLGGSWAIVESCGHPEQPSVALPVGGSGKRAWERRPGSAQPQFLVHAGETVHLWRREALLQMEMAAVVEENGALGGTVRVRLPRSGADGPMMPEEFTGVVRGRLDVEMEP